MADHPPRRARLNRSMTVDLETLKTELRAATSGDVDAARIATLTELERRANLAVIPEQIAALRETYVAGGGDLADLD